MCPIMIIILCGSIRQVEIEEESHHDSTVLSTPVPPTPANIDREFSEALRLRLRGLPWLTIRRYGIYFLNREDTTPHPSIDRYNPAFGNLPMETLIEGPTGGDSFDAVVVATGRDSRLNGMKHIFLHQLGVRLVNPTGGTTVEVLHIYLLFFISFF